MPVRRIPRSKTRAEFWVERLEGAESGEAALADAWRWFRKELTVLTEARAATGEAAAWDMARKVAGYAARLSRARIQLRRGLEPEERAELLDPWARRGDDPR
jgi:hypothetical protein